jgi:hypothetical protein
MKHILSQQTAGHIGLLHILLEALKKYGLEENWRWYLNSQSLYSDVLNSRCLAGFSSLKMTDEQLHILSDITHYGVYRSIPQKHDPLQTLVKCGYITTQDDQVYTFACPLIASFVQFFLYSRFSLKSQPTSLRDFLLSSLPNFRQSMLQNTKSKNVDMKVSEKFWQSEFYYASQRTTLWYFYQL